jgi:hypothetical protein
MVGLRGQRGQQVQRPRAQCCRAAVDEQAALGRLQFEAAAGSEAQRC